MINILKNVTCLFSNKLFEISCQASDVHIVQAAVSERQRDQKKLQRIVRIVQIIVLILY